MCLIPQHSGKTVFYWDTFCISLLSDVIRQAHCTRPRPYSFAVFFSCLFCLWIDVSCQSTRYQLIHGMYNKCSKSIDVQAELDGEHWGPLEIVTQWWNGMLRTLTGLRYLLATWYWFIFQSYSLQAQKPSDKLLMTFLTTNNWNAQNVNWSQVPTSHVVLIYISVIQPTSSKAFGQITSLLRSLHCGQILMTFLTTNN